MIMAKLYWTLKIGVDESWIEDGFYFSESHRQRLSENLIGHSTPDEVSVEIVKRPPRKKILDLQGR
jgi:hypothetical protein